MRVLVTKPKLWAKWRGIAAEFYLVDLILNSSDWILLHRKALKRKKCSLLGAIHEDCYSEEEEVIFPIARQTVSVYFLGHEFWNLSKLLSSTLLLPLKKFHSHDNRAVSIKASFSGLSLSMHVIMFSSLLYFK